MRKTPLICSLLMAFGLSTMLVGCDNGAKPSTPAPDAKSSKKADKAPGSSTGGGTSVPPASGKDEKPKK